MSRLCVTYNFFIILKIPALFLQNISRTIKSKENRLGVFITFLKIQYIKCFKERLFY